MSDAASPAPNPTISLEPVQATKRAVLCRGVDPDGSPTVYFASIGVASAYLASDTARCEATPHRCLPGAAPALECTCGFYALADRDVLRKRFGPLSEGQVDLDVALSGTVIEHEQGWRAQHQDVTRIWLKRSCDRCGRGCVPEHLAVLQERGTTQLLGPVCERCARKPKLPTYTRAQIATWAGVPVEVEPKHRLRLSNRRRTVVALATAVLLGLGAFFAVVGAPSWGSWPSSAARDTAGTLASRLEAVAAFDDAPAGRPAVVRGEWANTIVPSGTTLWAQVTPAPLDATAAGPTAAVVAASWRLVTPDTPIGPRGLPRRISVLAVVDSSGALGCLELDVPEGQVRRRPAPRCDGATTRALQLRAPLGR